MAVLAATAAWKYATYRYRIDGDRLVVREGLFERQVRQVPFARIHNVAVHQTLLHRMFGVAEVRLESAGGTRPEAEMRVLRLDQALALEQLIRDRGASAREETGDPGPDATAGATGGGRLLLALPLPELLRLGLASNRGMVVVAGAFAVAWQVLPERMLTRALQDAAGQALGYAGSLAGGLATRVMAAVLLVLLALVLLRLFSIVLAVLQFHGFRLLLQGRRLTAERGLLTRLRTSVPRRRIQSWTLREGLVHRLLRRRSLHVDTVSGAGEGGEERGLRELAPIATPEACDGLVHEVLPGVAWPPLGWRALHPRAWQRLALPGIALALVGTMAACWYFGTPGLLALAWAPWAVHAARQHARRAGYALDPRLCRCARRGVAAMALRRDRQAAALRFEQSPLDRWFAWQSRLRHRRRPAFDADALRFCRGRGARVARAAGRELARMPLRW